MTPLGFILATRGMGSSENVSTTVTSPHEQEPEAGLRHRHHHPLPLAWTAIQQQLQADNDGVPLITETAAMPHSHGASFFAFFLHGISTGSLLFITLFELLLPAMSQPQSSGSGGGDGSNDSRRTKMGLLMTFTGGVLLVASIQMVTGA